MAEYSIRDTTLVATADALRDRYGISDLIDPLNFGSMIMGLPSLKMLFNLVCVGKDTAEIPQVDTINYGAIFQDYLTFDTTTRKFTVIKEFTGDVYAWVYQYRSPRSTYSPGQFIVNGTVVASYKTTTLDSGATAGQRLNYHFSVGDKFWVYTPNSNGYPQQHLEMSVFEKEFRPCERLFYAQCYDNWQIEIPTITSLVQGTNYSSYVSYDTTTKKFTALQDFTGVIIGWVYTYQTYEASYSQGAFVVNNTRLATYVATGKAQGSTGGAYMVYNFKQGDEFYPYTPSTDGYPRQNCKVYLVSDLVDNIYTFADEEA